MSALIAPPGMYRVIRFTAYGVHEFVEDLATLDEAKARADALLPDSYNVCVFNGIGRAVHSALFPGGADFNRPQAATRAAGLDDPLKRPDAYKRRK